MIYDTLLMPSYMYMEVPYLLTVNSFGRCDLPFLGGGNLVVAGRLVSAFLTPGTWSVLCLLARVTATFINELLLDQMEYSSG